MVHLEVGALGYWASSFRYWDTGDTELQASDTVRDTGILWFSEQKAVNPTVIDTGILCFSEQKAVMVNTIIFQ